VLAGLLGTGVLVAVALMRRRAAIAGATAADAAVRRAAAEATQDRLRFLMRLDGLLLEVADTGAGIPADEIGQVWQELARGRAARSLPGTGIGLALVRVIAARHEGRVAIRSREGQGTVVSIRLPAPTGPGSRGKPVQAL
jgi:signal transduction histidine kinase